MRKCKKKGLIDRIDEKYVHRIGLCYKCKTVLEPLPLEQWYVNVKPLVDKSLEALDREEIHVYPTNFASTLKFWYKNLRDWNISRQNVWGIQIPIWYEVTDESKFNVTFIDKEKKLQQGNLHEILQKGYEWEEVINGLQRVIAMIDAKVVFEDQKEEGKKYLPETDTFDTWFSSSQWPYVTLQTTKKGDFETFYPTSVMETGRDILFFWVSRMIMMGLYATDTVPFKDVVLHGLVNDPLGKKMSKSKGNVVNPLEVADQYGADSVRMALVYGTGLGNDQAMSYEKLDASRKFCNKLWNMARFIEMKTEEAGSKNKELRTVDLAALATIAKHENDKAIVKAVQEVSDEITGYLDKYQFNLAAERLYDFIWHTYADRYIEDVKTRIDDNSSLILTSSFLILLKLLHPFMPFVTEAIFQKLAGDKESIMISKWPAA